MFKLLLFLFLLSPCGSRRSRQEAVCGPRDRRAVSELRPPHKVPAAYSLQCQSQPSASRPPSPRAQRRLPPARPACPTIPPHASPPVNRKPYPSDLTDAEWNTLEPLIPHFTPHSPSLASTLDTARTQSTAPVALQEHAANQQRDRRN